MLARSWRDVAMMMSAWPGREMARADEVILRNVSEAERRWTSQFLVELHTIGQGARNVCSAASWRPLSRLSQSALWRDHGSDDEMPLPATGTLRPVDAGHSLQESRDGFDHLDLWRRRRQRLPCRIETLRFVGWGEQPIVPNPLETGRQDMPQEAVNEHRAGQTHGSLRAAGGVSAHAKGHVLVIDADNSLVGDRHPMRVAPQILKDLCRAAKRLLGIDHPIMGVQGTFQIAPPRTGR